MGNQVLFDWFCGPFWNQKTKEERGGYPEIYFAGNNADPEALAGLIQYVKDRQQTVKKKPKVKLLAISKSGTTVESMAALDVFRRSLSGHAELFVVVITDKDKGALHELAKKQDWLKFSMPEGIGGRFSVFSQVGLVFAVFAGIDCRQFLAGAALVDEYLRKAEPMENPALLLAFWKYRALYAHGIAAEVIMPYGNSLRSFGWWYAQLLGESLGKNKDWDGNTIHNGRIPVPSLGTTDMHSLTQEHQQGQKNKVIQFISIEEGPSDIEAVIREKDKEGSIPVDRILSAALHANEEALASDGRMSCHVWAAKKTPFHLGALMYFFMMAISYEGALEHVNAYDQPGVEEYKRILHQYLYNGIT